MSEGFFIPTKSDSDREFLSQAGVGELLRGAILKMVEARSDDPIGFLADHFCHLASVTETGAQEQQHLNRALWHLRLAHHSQRSAFSNNVRVAYDLLNLTGPCRRSAEASTHRLCSASAVKVESLLPPPPRSSDASIAKTTRPSLMMSSVMACSHVRFSQTTSGRLRGFTLRCAARMKGLPRGHCAWPCWGP
uniref:Tubulin polyglutamylase complex subunit 1-like C-terminal domain-containing protein n=1 Tax=Dicentrarchus labrax TaxID=13489 RepID=A0A8C4FDG7_DICLA